MKASVLGTGDTARRAERKEKERVECDVLN